MAVYIVVARWVVAIYLMAHTNLNVRLCAKGVFLYSPIYFSGGEGNVLPTFAKNKEMLYINYRKGMSAGS